MNHLLRLIFLVVSVCYVTACTQFAVVKPVNSAAADTVISQQLIDDEDLLRDFKAISSVEFAGRKYNTAGNRKAQNYIIAQLQESKISPFNGQFKHPFDHARGLSDYQGTNIIGYKPGTSNKFIVITAHFDHLGKKSGKTYLGADDNASGTAGVIHIAKAFSQIQTTHHLIYLFTDAEEENLIGASAFAKENPEIMERTVLNVNLDMIAGDRFTKRLYYLPYQVDLLTESNWQGQLAFYAKKNNLEIRKGPRAYQIIKGQKRKTNWRNASDHGIFYRHKIPFLYFGVGTHKNYHTPDDTFENTNHAFYLAAVKTIFDQLHNFEQQIE